MQSRFVFSSESVTRGHPDKLCDQIGDQIVAGFLKQDPDAQVVAESAISTGIVFTSVKHASSTNANVDISSMAREAIADAGYSEGRFNARSCTVMNSVIEHAPNRALATSLADISDDAVDQVVAGVQSTLFGFACTHTSALMPLPIWLAHKLARKLDEARGRGLEYLSPDGKTQVAVEFSETRPCRIHAVAVIASRRRTGAPDARRIEDDLRELVLGPAFADEEIRPDERTRISISCEGRGGPYVHAGLTGRKGGADTYGEFARRADSALSGKDPTRVERIGSYAARYAAKQVVAAGLAENCEVQLSYWIGLPGPVSVQVETFGTAHVSEDEISARLTREFDFRVGALVRDFRLFDLDPYRVFPQLAAYGHFGRPELDLPWERLDKVDALR